MKVKKNKKKLLIIVVIAFAALAFIFSLYGYLWYIKNNNHLGIWQQELIILNEDYSVLEDNYIKIQFKEDNTFIYSSVNKEDTSDFFVDVGSFTREGDKIYLNYENSVDLVEEINLVNNRLYFKNAGNVDISNYLTKHEINVVRIKYFQMYEKINYNDYLYLLSNNEKAVVIVGRSDCHFTEMYQKEILKDIYLKYSIKFNYIDSSLVDETIDFIGTPTTLFLQNGSVIKKIDGYVEYKELDKIMHDLNY